jgi:putative hydrolase of the HAD superfamily
MSEIRAIGFDMGGVIITYAVPAQMQYLSSKLARSPEELEEAYHELREQSELGELRPEEFWKQYLASLGLELDAASTHHYWNDVYYQISPMLGGMLELVDKLKVNGYKVGMLSNMDTDHAELNRNRHIYDHFDQVILSNEVHLRKPAPEAYQALASALEVNFQEVVFIDDLELNVEGANKVGMKGVLFTDYRKLISDLMSLNINMS